MEVLAATVAGIITSVAAKGAEALAREVGKTAAELAESLRQTVLDRLRRDPLKQGTVERHKADPEAQEAAIASAIKDLAAADEAFAARLEQLVGRYEEARDAAVAVGRDMDGNVVVGDRNVVTRDNSGTINYGVDPD
jgi:hypothetical protein